MDRITYKKYVVSLRPRTLTADFLINRSEGQLDETGEDVPTSTQEGDTRTGTFPGTTEGVYGRGRRRTWYIEPRVAVTPLPSPPPFHRTTKEEGNVWRSDDTLPTSSLGDTERRVPSDVVDAVVPLTERPGGPRLGRDGIRSGPRRRRAGGRLRRAFAGKAVPLTTWSNSISFRAPDINREYP